MNKVKNNQQHTDLFSDSERHKNESKNVDEHFLIWTKLIMFESGCGYFDRHTAAHFTHPWFDLL